MTEVVTSSGRAASVEFRFRFDWVEVWHHDHCAAVLDRETLREWLAGPDDPLSVDELTLSLDRLVDRDGRIAITLPDVTEWTLSPDLEADLRRRA
jgi:hypothetical protein